MFLMYWFNLIWLTRPITHCASFKVWFSRPYMMKTVPIYMWPRNMKLSSPKVGGQPVLIIWTFSKNLWFFSYWDSRRQHVSYEICCPTIWPNLKAYLWTPWLHHSASPISLQEQMGITPRFQRDRHGCVTAAIQPRYSHQSWSQQFLTMLVFPPAAPQHPSAASQKQLAPLLCGDYVGVYFWWTEITAASVCADQIMPDSKSGSWMA